MPDFSFGAIEDHHLKIEKVKLIVSSEVKQKGKGAMKSLATGRYPTDAQIESALVASAILLPASDVILTPLIATQGTEGSCVAFAVGYEARSIAHYYATKANSYNNSVNVFSPEFLFDLTKSSICSAGSSVLNAMDFLKNAGIVKWATIPYVSGSCDLTPTSDQLLEASGYKISGYSYVLSSDQIAVKTAIVNRQALIITIGVDSAFINAGPDFIWTTKGTFVGLHCVTIIGYDDSKHAYKIMNHWGTGWGASGYSWIDYDLLPQLLSYATVIDGIVPAPISGPYPPVPNAGFDESLLTTGAITLDATASYDPDGYIVSYLWSLVSGPNTPTITNPNNPVASVLTGLIPGTYVYKVTVVDNDGNTNFATVTKVVTSAQVISINVNKKKVGKNIADVITWQVSMDAPPISSQLEQSWSATTNFNKIFDLPTPSGTYTTAYIDPTKTRSFRYYRLKIITAAGDTIYSDVKPIK